MGIIDFRMRPLYGGYLSMAEAGTTDKFLTGLRCQITPSIRECSIELLVKEMDEAGIEKAVIPGRQSPGTFVDNQELCDLAMQWPGRFIPFPLYDPLRPKESLEEVRRILMDGPGGGVTIEPGFGNTLRFDDPGYFPLYRWLEDNGIPLMLTFSGSITPTIDCTLPGRLDLVAQTHPNLKIVVGHAGWPWSKELICMGFFRRNIYLAPDLYSMASVPGSEDYRLAAAGMLQDRFLFGSSYPLVPLGEAVDNVRAWKLDPACEQRVLHDTAAELLSWKF